MSENKRLQVSDIDFESIRDNLKDYLRSQDTFQDYDFEGSAISTLVDLMSYVTHYNAVNANLGLNETFLDTAQFRGSVVGHARQLGYTPQSASAPVARVNVSVSNVPDGERITLNRGHVFKAKINNTTYQFITTEEHTTSTGVFENVEIAQIRTKTAEYVYDSNSNEKFLIPDENVDTSTLYVRVLDSRNSDSFTVFVPAKYLTSIESNSNVYFLNENPDGLFEVSFGDGIIGSELENGNVIRLEYGVTEKDSSNGARIFSTPEAIGGYSEISVSTVDPARGGGDKESTDSIRHIAPLSYASQNRAVTSTDYETIVKEEFDNLQSVKAWGGENNDPPQYGKVFVSVQPKTSERLTANEKNHIVDSIIKPKSVVSVTPEIIDPEYLHLTFETFFKYDPSKTNESRNDLENNVTNAIRNWNLENLNEFDTVFRYSNFLKMIDSVDDAILNSFSRVYITRRFVPTLNTKVKYELDYSVDLFESFGTRPVIRRSSTFTVNGISDCYFTDLPTGDEDNGSIREIVIAKGSGVKQEIIQRDVGKIENHKITLTDFVPSDYDGTYIGIEVIPNSYDIAGSFNTILTIDCDCDRYKVQGYIDTIATNENDSGTDYLTFDKNE